MGNLIKLNRKYIIAVFILALSLFLHLFNLTETAPVTDERFWYSRSLRTVNHLTTNPSKYSNHLVHPGVPPSIIMGISQKVATGINKFYNYKAGDDGYLYGLDAARFGIAFTTAFIPIVAFLGLEFIFGIDLAILSALLLALDPQLLAASRMAHLDAMLVLFVTLSIFLYTYALKVKKAQYKIFAGICWGLAIATKPTAIILAAGFLIYKIINYIFNFKQQPEFFITWSDIWAVISGLIVFCSIWSQLWWINSPYLSQFKFPYMRKIFKFHQYFNTYSAAIILLIFSLFLIFLIFNKYYRTYRNKIYLHVQGTAALMLFLVVTFNFFPQIYVNLLKYWLHVFDLIRIPNLSLITNQKIEAEPLGYLVLAWSYLPDFVLPLIVLAFVFLTLHLLKKDFSVKTLWILFAAITVTLWFTQLNMSAKQSWRYALPIVPVLYAISVFGLFNLLKNNNLRIVASVILLLVVTYLNLRLWPDLGLYRSYSSGGLKAASLDARVPAHAGYKPVLNYLVKTQKTLAREINVRAYGDTEIQVLAVRKWFYKDSKNIVFNPKPGTKLDLALVYAPIKENIAKLKIEKNLEYPAVYTKKISDFNVVSLFKVVN